MAETFDSSTCSKFPGKVSCNYAIPQLVCSINFPERAYEKLAYCSIYKAKSEHEQEVLLPRGAPSSGATKDTLEEQTISVEKLKAEPFHISENNKTCTLYFLSVSVRCVMCLGDTVQQYENTALFRCCSPAGERWKDIGLYRCILPAPHSRELRIVLWLLYIMLKWNEERKSHFKSFCLKPTRLEIEVVEIVVAVVVETDDIAKLKMWNILV